MFFRSKLFKFLLTIFSYFLFAIIWVYNYKEVWYNNIPEETLYFKRPYMEYYTMIAYVFMASFIVYLVFGLIYLIKKHVPGFVTYLLIIDLIISAYCIWIYAVTFNNWRTNSFLLFINMAMFAISIYQLLNLTKSLTQLKKQDS